MAKERDEAHQDDGLLDDTSLDDLRLDEVDLETQDAERGTDRVPVDGGDSPVQASLRPDDGARNDSDEEIDLDSLLEDLGEDQEEVDGELGASEDDLLSEEDLLTEEDLISDGDEATIVEEESGAEIKLDDDATDKLPGEADEEIDLDDLLAGDDGGEATDVLSDEELLGAATAEEPAPAPKRHTEILDEAPVPEPPADEFAAPEEDTPLAEEAAVEEDREAAAEEEPEPEEEEKEKKKKAPRKTVKIGKGRPSRLGAKPKFGKERAKRPKEDRKAKEARPVAPVGGAVRFICSECYEEFHLPADYSGETVTCPECLHVGKRPDDNFLRTVNVHKKEERKSLALTVAVGAGLVIVLFILVWVNTPYVPVLESFLAGLGLSGVELDAREVTFGLLGGGGILTIILLWLLVRFESNRWEVYF